MMPRFAFALVAFALAACGWANDEASGNAPAAQPSAEPARDLKGGALVHTLSADGLELGLAFGVPRAQAVATATEAFGAPTGTSHNGECGAGPMDFVDYRGLSLAFQDGLLAGWSIDEELPALRTADGLAVGAPRDALGGAPVEQSTLGPEFDVGGIGGLLDEEGREIAVLWAGLTCHFR